MRPVTLQKTAGRAKGKYTAQFSQGGFNITPLLDVLFIIIIFFSVGTEFKELQDAFNISLPQATSGEALQEDQGPLEIHISEEGKIIIGEEEVLPEALAERPEITGAANRADAKAVIFADEGIPYGLLILVMDALRNNNIDKIHFAVSKK